MNHLRTGGNGLDPFELAETRVDQFRPVCTILDWFYGSLAKSSFECDRQFSFYDILQALLETGPFHQVTDRTVITKCACST